MCNIKFIILFDLNYYYVIKLYGSNENIFLYTKTYLLWFYSISNN